MVCDEKMCKAQKRLLSLGLLLRSKHNQLDGFCAWLLLAKLARVRQVDIFSEKEHHDLVCCVFISSAQLNQTTVP